MANKTVLNPDKDIELNSLLDVSAISSIEDDILHEVDKKFNGFREEINKRVNSELNEKLDEIVEEFNSSTTQDKLDILTQLENIEYGKDGMEDMRKAIDSVKRSIVAIEEGQESVLNEDDVSDILKAALVDGTFIDDNVIGSNTVLGNKIVGLVGTFGKIKASNIEGDEISGKTIKSISDRWCLGKDGDGKLAGGNIEWDQLGNVTFGPNVKLSWNSVKDIPADFGQGTSIFTSTVFIRQNDMPKTPMGGNFDDPLPNISIANGDKWLDSIPSGSEILWSSTRVFASKKIENSKNYWTEPVQMTDTSSFKVIYGIESASTNVEDLPSLPVNTGFVDYNGWYDNETDIPEDSEIYYMATASSSNGVWSNWNISKIKGEKGEDGKSINIRSSYETLDDFKTVAGENLNVEPIDDSYAYVVEGDLYIWDNDNAKWTNIGKFAG